MFKTSAKVLWELAPVRAMHNGKLTVTRYEPMNCPTESLDRLDNLTKY